MITIISVGKAKSIYHPVLKHYQKMLAEPLKIITIKDQKDRHGRLREAKDILKAIPPKSYVVLLDITGKTMSSTDFAHWLKPKLHQITFIIGGSYGVEDVIRARADFRLSFSPFTFPHQMAKLLLLEQIYRATTIINRHPYHK